MTTHLFFYGTLIPQFAPPHLRETLAGCKLVGEAWMRGTLYNLGNFPGAVLDDASPDKIFGRVYSAPDDDQLLAALDLYEGYDPASPATSQYLRQRREAVLAGGEKLACWVYHYNGNIAGVPFVPGGRWKGTAGPS